MTGNSDEPRDEGMDTHTGNETSPDRTGARIDANGEPQDPDSHPSEQEDRSRGRGHDVEAMSSEPSSD